MLEFPLQLFKVIAKEQQTKLTRSAKKITQQNHTLSAAQAIFCIKKLTAFCSTMWPINELNETLKNLKNY